MEFKGVKKSIDEYRQHSAESLRIKFEPVYKKYWPERLASMLDCNVETIRKYRSKKNPRKPTYEYYVLLLALLKEQKAKKMT